MDKQINYWMDVCQSQSLHFKNLWEQGAGFEDNPEQLIEIGARAVIAARIVEANSGFMVSWAARRFRT